jgi:hypothetical protein
LFPCAGRRKLVGASVMATPKTVDTAWRLMAVGEKVIRG